MRDYAAVSVLGSTGSIGTQTLEICRMHQIPVVALAAKKNICLLEKQSREFLPEIVSVEDETAARDLKVRLADTSVQVVGGTAGAEEAAVCQSSAVVVAAMVGTAGLLPVMAAIREGKKIALANKETLVCAGSLVMEAAAACGAQILPVDSEHSAIFQSMDNKAGVRPIGIKLTASGGPFRGMTREQVEKIPPEKALKHPNWNMGAKVTVDSATMMNKGLELIEAMHLFDVAPEQIEILVHPQSILHSAVEFEDGSIIGQLGLPDMRIPIQYALLYPERRKSPVSRLSLSEIGSLTFEKPDLETFRCLAVARRCASAGTAACAAMNAANEIAVNRYLNGDIFFGEIDQLVEQVVSVFSGHSCSTLEEILQLDAEARKFAAGISF